MLMKMNRRAICQCIPENQPSLLSERAAMRLSVMILKR